MKAPIDEILDRVRRIETRTTIIGRHLGAEVGGGRPEWRSGKVHLPTPNCTINELMQAIPNSWRGRPIAVLSANDEYLFDLRLPPE